MLLSATPTSSALKLLAQRRQLHTINTALAGFVVTAIKASSGGQQVWRYMCVFMERQGYVRLLSSKFFMITVLYSMMGERGAHVPHSDATRMSFHHSRPAVTEGGLTQKTTTERRWLFIFECFCCFVLICSEFN